MSHVSLYCLVLCLYWGLVHCSTSYSVTRSLLLPPEVLNQQQEAIESSIFDDPQFELDRDSSSSNITMANCGVSRFKAEDDERIVGGRPAAVGQFPWQVYLRIETAGGDMLCGGSILNSRWILTAAHCISSEQTGQYHANAVEVLAGTLDRFGFGPSRQSRYADCVLKHPRWTGVRGGFANDIALIRIPASRPLTMNANVRGICLPPKSRPPFDYTGVGRVAGWGLTRDRGAPSRNLQYTDVSVISDSQCRQYQYPVNIIDSMVCQGVDTSSPCQGDSGGPLLIRSANRYVQFGIVSFGPGICNNGRIPNAVYTQVSHHMNWIESVIRSYDKSPSCGSRQIVID